MSKLNTADDILARMERQPNGCVIWQGCCSSGQDGGYGWVRWQKKQIKVHRWAYEYFQGPIPPGMWVLHRCDTRNCANPDHLFVGTAADNARDMATKGRANYQIGKHPQKYRFCCAKGHEYTKENTWLRTKKNGRVARVCLTCKREIYKKFLAKRRGHLLGE